MIDMDLIEDGWELVIADDLSDLSKRHLGPLVPGTHVKVIQKSPSLPRWVLVEAKVGDETVSRLVHRCELDYPVIPDAPAHPAEG